ncbi:MAG: hypothetical protein JST92_05960, partial [Deltaproteobacteria bacterium]|nr:hypothetical protein [Deltaproteobacteria bacterium]
MTEASTAAAWQVFDGWTAAVSPTRSTASWKVLDEFEARLVQAAANNLVRLQELLGAWDERLAATQDPSREDWRLFPKLRPEPTASDALAHFLDESRSTHLAELFQTTDPSLEPEGVEREVFVRAPNRADGRSIDLVIRWPGARRSSIEIKIDDTQLLKTRDAADLAEESFPSEWTHFL